jgi:hypothetical protein
VQISKGNHSSVLIFKYWDDNSLFPQGWECENILYNGTFNFTNTSTLELEEENETETHLQCQKDHLQPEGSAGYNVLPHR